MLFERITSVRAGAVSKKLSSDFDRTTDTLVLSASDQIDTEGVPVIDWMMLGCQLFLLDALDAADGQHPTRKSGEHRRIRGRTYCPSATGDSK